MVRAAYRAAGQRVAGRRGRSVKQRIDHPQEMEDCAHIGLLVGTAQEEGESA